MSIPVVIIAYNRPNHTRLLVSAVLEYGPSSVLLICDGPRSESDRILVDEVRHILLSAPWKCPLFSDFSESNLGCRDRVHSGLNWAFSIVDMACVLEDDCLPTSAYFVFCEVMLSRYYDRNDIFMVSGTNYVSSDIQGCNSYLLSRYVQIWGWATWRRAWALYRDDVSDYHQIISDRFKGLARIRPKLYWLYIFYGVSRGTRSGWAGRWMLTLWRHSAFCVVPSHSLVSNIGFDQNATNTKVSPYNLRPVKILFPPYLSSSLDSGVRYDIKIENTCYSRSFYNRCGWFLSRFLGFVGRIKFALYSKL